MSFKKDWLMVLVLVAAAGFIVAATVGSFMWGTNRVQAEWRCPCGAGRKESCRIVEADFDMERCVRTMAHVNAQGFAVPMDGGGYAISEYRQFAEGPWDAETVHLRADGNPVGETEFTYAPISRHRFDQNKKLTVLAWFDKNGNAINNPRLGYHSARYEYDNKARAASTAFFDLDGAPVMHPGHGAHRMVDVYDEATGKLSALRYYDTAGKIIKEEPIVKE